MTGTDNVDSEDEGGERFSRFTPPEGYDETVVDAFGEAVCALVDEAADSTGAEVENGYVDTCVSVVDHPDPYNAFVTTFTASTAPAGPLDDLRVAVKDNVAVAGVTHTVGSRAFSWQPDRDADVTARLRDAGADLCGTTDMDPFALGTTGEWSVHGRTLNPAVEGHVPGGSSSGAAAAVAGDLVDAAVGTDTGGSLRIPASYCGVVGVKPTFGAISTTGVVPLAPSLDHVGVLATDVETACRMLDVLTDRRAGTPPRAGGTVDSALGDVDENDLTVGLVTETVTDATPGVERTVRSALDTMAADVVPVSCPEWEDAAAHNDAATVIEFASLFGDAPTPVGRGLAAALAAVGTTTDSVEAVVAESVCRGCRLVNADSDVYGATVEGRRQLTRRTERLFEQCDVLASPTTRQTAPRFGEIADGADVRQTLRNTAPFDNTGQPAVSVPCGTHEGHPVGIQFVAPFGADGSALAAAHQLERALDTH